MSDNEYLRLPHGMYDREEELKNGPPVIWLDEDYPPFIKED